MSADLNTVKEFRLELPEKSTGGMSICMIGSTRSGKTTFLRHLLRSYYKDHVAVLMSPNIHARVYDDLDKHIIQTDCFRPEIINDMYTINKKCDNHYEFLAVLDDIVTAKFNKDLLKLFTTHRNAGVSGIMCIQSPILLNSAMRGNLNVVMLGYMNSDESCEKVIRMFCYATIPGRNVEEKIHEYKRLTADHHWIVINNLTGECFRTKLRLG
jgi:GTPase SAR1 family protein